jgi:hypothetical protein
MMISPRYKRERQFGAYLEVDRIVNESVDWLNQEGFHTPPVAFILLLLDPDKLAKVTARFLGKPLDQQRGAFQSDNVWLVNFQM